MPPDQSNGPDFGALLAQAPTAPASTGGQTPTPASSPPDFKALLTQGEPAPKPEDNAAANPKDFWNRYSISRVAKGIGRAGQMVDAGLAGAAGGVLSAVADQIDPKLGNAVAQKSQQLQTILRGGVTGGKMDLGDKVAQGFGEALPFMALGAPGGAVRTAGMGALAGATAPQSGATPEARNTGRIIGAAAGTVIPGALQFGGNAAAKVVTKVANAKALDGVIKQLSDTFENYTPTATALAAHVGEVSAATVKNYANKVDFVRTIANKTAQPDGDALAKAVNGAVTGNSKSPTNKLIQSFKNVTDEFESKPAPDADKMKQFAGYGEDAQQQIAKQSGWDLKPVPGKKVDFFQLDGMKRQIDDHLEGLSADELKSPEVAKLKEVQASVQKQMDFMLDANPMLKKHYTQLEQQFKPVMELMKDPQVAGLMSNNPETRVNTILSAVTRGDSEGLKKMAPLLGGPNSATRESAYHVVLHDAYVQSIDKESGKVNAAKFTAYFDNPNVKKALPILETPQGNQVRKGIENFIDFSNLPRNDTHRSLARYGEQTGTWMVGRALERTIEAGVHGKLAIGSLGSSIAAAALLRKGSQMADGLLSNKMGVNFLLASSRLKPGSPQMAGLVTNFMKQASRLAPVAGQQVGPTQAPPPGQ